MVRVIMTVVDTVIKVFSNESHNHLYYQQAVQAWRRAGEGRLWSCLCRRQKSRQASGEYHE